MQGTRSATGKMAEFKKGAFTVAAKEGAPVVPITLDGTGRLMRNGTNASLRAGCSRQANARVRARDEAVPGKGHHHRAPADSRRRRGGDVRCRASRRRVRSGAEVPRAEERRRRQGVSCGLALSRGASGRAAQSAPRETTLWPVNIRWYDERVDADAKSTSGKRRRLAAAPRAPVPLRRRAPAQCCGLLQARLLLRRVRRAPTALRRVRRAMCRVRRSVSSARC